jgi:ParB family transcriptional regulator, chromosome partitioning protein
VAESSRPRGLGRGLAALVAEFPTGATSMVELEIGQVRPNPRQPRRAFDDEAIQRLSESVKADGVVQPIVVRDVGDGYEIVAGERRWRAARLAGLRTIPAIVRTADDRELLILALAENVAREDLNPIDQARAYAVLADELDLTQTEIARRVGKSRPAVANTMRLLERRRRAVRGPRPRAAARGRSGRALEPGPHGGQPGLVGARVRGRRQARLEAGQARAETGRGGHGRRARPPRRRRRLAVARAARLGAAGAARRPCRAALLVRRRAGSHRRPAARGTRLLGGLNRGSMRAPFGGRLAQSVRAPL